jgi:hypothetical protein
MIPYDLISVLKIFKKEKWLTSEEYNSRLRHEVDNIARFYNF